MIMTCRLCGKPASWRNSGWIFKYCSWSHSRIDRWYSWVIFGALILFSTLLQAENDQLTISALIWIMFLSGIFFTLAYFDFQKKKRWNPPNPKIKKFPPFTRQNSIQMKKSTISKKPDFINEFVCSNCGEDQYAVDVFCRECGTEF